jgi:pyridoxal phosphate enzyme (YggS family)
MIAENVENIRRRIDSACRKAGRAADDVTLIAVSKTFGTDVMRDALRAGIRDFGENYVQETREKYAELSGENLRLHFIGHLQTNKVKYIAPWIDSIHSVDSVALGESISGHAKKARRTINVLVEVNTSGETTKFGVAPEDASELVRQLSVLPNINVRGLMTIGPFLPDPESSRPSFRTLRDVKSAVEQGGIPLHDLSMGMTNDFEVAIDEGATMVRIGTAIFGKRSRAIA